MPKWVPASDEPEAASPEASPEADAGASEPVADEAVAGEVVTDADEPEPERKTVYGYASVAEQMGPALPPGLTEVREPPPGPTQSPLSTGGRTLPGEDEPEPEPEPAPEPQQPIPGVPPQLPPIPPSNKQDEGGGRDWKTIAKALSVPVTLLAGLATIIQVVVTTRAPEPGDQTPSPWQVTRAAFEALRNQSLPDEDLLEGTVVRESQCDTKHSKPFVIEWDATDMSTFESVVASDVVFVRYSGCNLEILEGCRDFSVPGRLGAYRPPVWTTGSLETLDVSDRSELRAKLPLGDATFGDRVESGEKLHMEYYVSGTAYATREAVYASDLSGLSRCEGATHFVHAYNLGAFALGSTKDFKAETGTTVFGHGAEAKRERIQAADKHGGDLGACGATDTDQSRGCRIPIRLTLLPITPGENPDAEAMKADLDDAELNAIGALDAKLEAGERALAHYSSAEEKAQSKDGAGCLAELDARDQLVTSDKSTDSTSYFSMLRARCLMLSGKCQAGKALMGTYFEQHFSDNADQVVYSLDHAVTEYCGSSDLTPRDHFVQSYSRIFEYSQRPHTDPQLCLREAERAKKYRPQIQPRNATDTLVVGYDTDFHMILSRCLGWGGDCDAAFRAYVDEWPAGVDKDGDGSDAAMRDGFVLRIQPCKAPR